MATRWFSVLTALAAMAVVGNGARAADTATVELISRNLDVWRKPHEKWILAADVAIDGQDKSRLIFKPGDAAVVNGPKGKIHNLISVQEFGDVEAHVEFMIPARSNSGVYLMGRYEVQIYDSHGVEKDEYPGIECGGIYPRWVNNQRVEGHSPRVNASLPPGQWQTFDVVFRAPHFDASGKKIRNAQFVKVVHNGRLIHENVELNGPTRSGLSGEKPTGPIMLQGDHGPVAFRSVRIRTL
jgi:hypothetical protein